MWRPADYVIAGLLALVLAGFIVAGCIWFVGGMC